MSYRAHNPVRLALAALLVGLWSGLVTGDDAQRPVHYVVPANSLWQLANRYLGTPYAWRTLWQLNPQIENPNLIFPGDRIYLPINETGDPDASAAVHLASTSQPLATRISLPMQEPQTPSVTNQSLVSQTESGRETPTNDALGALPATAQARTQPAVEIVSTIPEAGERSSSAGVGANPRVATSSSSGGFRSLTVPAPAPVQERPAYVDRLLDPNTPNDTFNDYRPALASRSWVGAVDHSIDLLSLYRDDDVNFDSSLDYGLQYSARVSTRNWGDLRLNLIALDEFGDFQGDQGVNNGLFQQQSGIARFTLEQTNLPVTEQITMDNIVGMHRQRRYNPFRERPNLINYRFSAAEPDVLGLSSQLKFGRSGIGISVGELGQTRGTLLPGFRKLDGSIQRGQFTRVVDRHALSAEVWQTEGQTQIDNRQGYRLAYDRLLSDHTVISLSGVASGSQQAFLLGGATQSTVSQHDYGAYYFEPDIIWLDNRIGDDNAGAFYRFNSQRGPRSFGASIELRRDGLSQDATFQADTAFVNLSLAMRLNRRSALSNVYGYRRVEAENSGQRSFEEHSLRSYLTLSHTSNTRSNLGVLTRLRAQQQELELSYGWAHDLDDGSAFEIASRFRHQFANSDEADEMAMTANWRKQFSQGTHLGLGLGYAYGSSRLADSRGLTGYLSLEHQLTNRLGLSLQLDYSRDQADYDNEDLADTLFTNDALREDSLDGFRTFSALLRLSYQLNGGQQPTVLRGSNFAQGAGRVQGVVFVDANGDGERQPDEAGVPGVTLFLNSVHPVVTDARGVYRFPSVSPGQHFLFIDEAALPLPWTLRNREYTALEVQLRRTTELDIPLSTITLADAQQTDSARSNQ